jgi:glycosyltransferase involved in cell wall biosynthesis
MPSKLLRAADICVLPFDGGVRLHNSSFSFCAAHGLPIITTKSNDTEAEFIDGDNVSLISSGNAELLSRAIETLKSNDNLRKKLCDGSLSLFEKTFSWKQALEKTLAVYKNTNHDF